MGVLIKDYRSRALPRSYSLGAGKRVFEIGMVSMLAFSGPGLAYSVGAIVTAAKLTGVQRERALIGRIAELAQQPAELANLQQEIKELDVAQQERLTTKLAKRGVDVRDLALTVKGYKELFAQPRPWSLGAGRQIVNKIWLGVAWGIGMWPVAIGAQPLALGVLFCSLLTGVMLGAAKIWGTVREHGQIKKVANLIKSDEDRAQLRRLMADQGFSPALQARLIDKLHKGGINV
jgi:hypothetical protein